MKTISYHSFISKICEDNNMSVCKFYHLKLPTDREQIKSFTTSRANRVKIIDKNHNRLPYMLSNTTRNEEALINGVSLEVNDYKSLKEILEETKVQLKISSVKISEGGGWYSQGTRYEYNDIACEI